MKVLGRLLISFIFATNIANAGVPADPMKNLYTELSKLQSALSVLSQQVSSMGKKTVLPEKGPQEKEKLYTAMIDAVEGGKIGDVKNLVGQIGREEKDYWGMLILDAAQKSTKNHFEIIKYLFENAKDKPDLDYSEQDKESAVFKAIASQGDNSLQILSYLIEKGADLTTKGGSNNETPLEYAERLQKESPNLLQIDEKIAALKKAATPKEVKEKPKPVEKTLSVILASPRMEEVFEKNIKDLIPKDLKPNVYVHKKGEKIPEHKATVSIVISEISAGKKGTLIHAVIDITDTVEWLANPAFIGISLVENQNDKAYGTVEELEEKLKMLNEKWENKPIFSITVNGDTKEVWKTEENTKALNLIKNTLSKALEK